MISLSDRFAAWMAEHDPADDPATPAATVLALRDTADGPEVLMLQRNAKGSFAGNWVFPGGKVDPEDFAGDTDLLAASERAARREALEEADLELDNVDLIPFAHWMPPSVVPRRFSTWFFAGAAPAGTAGDVTIDGGEIVDHLWVRPEEALTKHAAGEVELVPPTWITLTHLSGFDSTVDALAWIAARELPFYLTRRIGVDPLVVAWHGDAGYEPNDASVAGGRHRITMHPDGWVFEEPR